MAGMTNEDFRDFGDLGDILRRITVNLSCLTNVYGLDGGARAQRGDPCGDPPLSQDQA
jgi:hypothetical protein